MVYRGYLAPYEAYFYLCTPPKNNKATLLLQGMALLVALKASKA